MSLDHESLALLRDLLPRYTPTPGMPPQEARQMALELGRLLQGEPPHMSEVREISAAADDGRGIPLRLYRPFEADGGWILWIHGGGFMTGGLDTHDTLCRRLAEGSGQTVISIDYRLAPEYPYPAALEDCETAFRWLIRQSNWAGLDPDRAAIGGSSAGGNLTAALAIANRDRDNIPIRLQVLVYPCVDATMSMASASPNGQGYQLTSAMMAHYLDAYCGDLQDRRAPTLSPLFLRELEGLPPAEVLIAELDPLAEEGLAYARKLENAGVPTQTHVFEGVMHGFFAQAGVLQKGRDAQALVCAALRKALKR